ncbi:MAG: hypothetical protein IJM92_01220 [Fibrobacter sp.]|uniref:hypothetical protein n=1 Tax=Fibrobacter sp. TaxID=35828 RepID=UPI0025C1B3DC|nr:hypothetical protein [Fibrobacter sp.]MBQ7078296.1 hypothetical protein [Fibrobacter sp.]
MKNVKLMALVALAFMVSTSFGAELVKSKRGDIEVTSEKEGGRVICTANFNDELAILKKSDTAVLVKGKCGQGWVAKSKIEMIAKGPSNKSMSFGDVDVHGWLDNPDLRDVNRSYVNEVPEVEINRDFKEYLAYTMDREQTEMRNGEN